MRKRQKIFFSTVGLILGAALLFSLGCAGRSQSARFYILNPLAAPETKSESITEPAGDLAVGILPVSLPKYLRKPQIVTRTGDNELRLAEYDRWAGKLEEDIARVVAENLSQLLGTDKVYTSTFMGTVPPDYSISIDIIRFDGRLGGDLEFQVRWAVFDDRDKAVYGMEATKIIKPAAGGSYADMVAAQSSVLYDFSLELAAAIKKLQGS